MKLLAIVIALLIERYLGPLSTLRNYSWFHRYARWLNGRLQAIPALKPAALLLVLLPVVLATILLFEFFDGWIWGLIPLLMAAVVLVYTLGDTNLDKLLEQYAEAVELGDEERQLHLAEQIIGSAEVSSDASERISAITEYAFVSANQRLFAVVFWFLMLGPVGALIYRLSSELRHASSEDGFPCSTAWIAVLDWLPTRLLAITLALIGRFDTLLPIIQDSISFKLDTLMDDNEQLLRRAGAAVVDLEGNIAELDEADSLSLFMRSISNVLTRALIVWGTVLAVLVLIA